MGKVIALCISKEKGTKKENIGSGKFIADFGIESDAHAGSWHRQVSLLSYEKFKAFQNQGASIEYGAFGENLLIAEIDFKNLQVGTRFQSNDVILELTQIGKECHSHCAIYHQVGDCIMPREGVFAVVIQGGIISVGDDLNVL